MVWDGCSILETEKLEKVQLYAARIVTGLPILALKNRYIMKLVVNHYAKEEENPNWQQCTKYIQTLYLNTYVTLLPIFERNAHSNNRNEEKYLVPKCRLDI